MKKLRTPRHYLIFWMYGVSAVHFFAGVFLAFAASSHYFDHYHQTVLHKFWINEIPVAATTFQIWWASLFGATLQNLAIYLGVLNFLGDRYRHKVIWMWMIIGVVIWAPQDMFISLHAGMLLHVWVDCFALLVMIPPLVSLWIIDRKPHSV